MRLFIHVSFPWEVLLAHRHSPQPYVGGCHGYRWYIRRWTSKADVWEIPTSCLGFTHTSTTKHASVYQNTHPTHTLPISLHSSSLPLCQSSIFLDTLLQHCCALLTPASQVEQLPCGCLKWCNMDLIIWAKVELNRDKNKNFYCKRMQYGSRRFWDGLLSSTSTQCKLGHICSQQLLMLVVRCSVYVSTFLLIAAENLPVCVTVGDILKTTQTRETRMDMGCRGWEALCICCTFTWFGLFWGFRSVERR